MDTYQTGSDSTPIALTVDITTIGLAATRAIVVNMNSTDSGISVAQSEDATGDIPGKDIGKPETLKNKRLTVFTRIDLTGNDLPARKQEFARITASYTLSNGTDGEKKFDAPTRTTDANYLIIFLQENIDLI